MPVSTSFILYVDTFLFCYEGFNSYILFQGIGIKCRLTADLAKTALFKADSLGLQRDAIV